MPRPDEPPASALRAVRYSYEWFRTWRYVIVQPSVKNVGFAVATFSNRHGLQVFPGVKRLMAITGHSKPSVIDALAAMRWLGFIYRIASAQGSNSGKADEYQLCTPRTWEHVPMADAKTGREPEFDGLPLVAQHAAVRLKVAGRLQGSGQLRQPGGQLRQPGVVVSLNHWWLPELTPPTHRTNTSTKSDTHHPDRHDRPDAAASGREYDFDNEDDAYDYVIDTIGDDLDPYEGAMVDGMLSRGAHPHSIVNAIRAGRGASDVTP